jgi:hypothetical protein
MGKNMKFKFVLLTLTLSFGLVTLSSNVRADDGEALTLHNQTGHPVVMFVLQNDAPDLDPEDGVQAGEIANGGSAVAHVPHCHFGILLVDHEDVWHAEFHDCSSTDYTFTKDTGHAKREHHHS